MTLQLQLSDKTYPKEETGRGGLTGTALPCIWTSKTKELMELFQTPLLEGWPSLKRTNGRCSGTESHPAEKEMRNKTVQRMISAAMCPLGWAIPSGFWWRPSHGAKHSGWLSSDRDSWRDLMLNLGTGKPGERGSMGKLWAGMRAAGLHRNRVLVTTLPCLRDNNWWSL